MRIEGEKPAVHNAATPPRLHKRSVIGRRRPATNKTMNFRNRPQTTTQPRKPARIASALGALLAFVALATTADSARADCVHGVSVSSRLDREGNHSRGEARHFELLRKVGAVNEQAERLALPDSENSDSPSPFPCSGPFCSNRAPVPLAPGPVHPPRPPQWAGAVGRSAPTPIASVPFAQPFESIRPNRLAPAVFHPPRVVSLPSAIVPA